METEGQLWHVRLMGCQQRAEAVSWAGRWTKSQEPRTDKLLSRQFIFCAQKASPAESSPRGEGGDFPGQEGGKGPEPGRVPRTGTVASVWETAERGQLGGSQKGPGQSLGLSHLAVAGDCVGAWPRHPWEKQLTSGSYSRWR